ncbi:hypothetical protein AYK20_08510 [Thermoplasmatales archaeon SG8-52-1]|nr:MAG: hypothetical protein AYK20_08510 [Thermoplasmatales archaeon SG8-52-1]
MKFLLIQTGEWKKNTEGPWYDPSGHPPLGLLYIGAALEKVGHKVEILDFCAENISKQKINNSLRSSDAVGINVHTKNYQHAMAISKEIKELDSSVTIVIGGPHCTHLQRQSLSDIPYADICVVGEGEYVILDIVRFIQGEKNISDIHGIHYRKKNSVKSGKPLQVIDDLDALPFPARHLVDKYDYAKL